MGMCFLLCVSVVYLYIYIYIIYNIIKIKKRTHPQGYTHTEEKTDTQPKLRVAFLVKIGSTVCCDPDFRRNPQLATLQLGCALVFTQLESE